MTGLVTFGETPLRFSAPPNQRLEMAREASIYADGKESNVAVAAQELGAETLWLSKQPATPLGRRVVTQLQEQGIETEVAWADPEEGLRQGLTFRESGVPPRSPKSWQDRQNTAASTAEPSDFPMQTIQSADVVFTGLSTPVLSENATETTKAILRASGGGGAVTAADLDFTPGLKSPAAYRDSLEALAGEIDLLFATEDTIEAVIERNGNARELTNIIAAELDLEIVVIVKGNGGAVALHDSPGTNVIHERETLETDVVDETGQHSAFIGAFLQQLISGADTANALTSAVAAKTIVGSMEGPFLTVDGNELEPVIDDIIEKS